MYDTMLELDGVGLAAPQIGVLKRAAVVDIGDDTGRIELVNPEAQTAFRARLFAALFDDLRVDQFNSARVIADIDDCRSF